MQMSGDQRDKLQKLEDGVASQHNQQLVQKREMTALRGRQNEVMTFYNLFVTFPAIYASFRRLLPLT